MKKIVMVVLVAVCLLPYKNYVLKITTSDTGGWVEVGEPPWLMVSGHIYGPSSMVACVWTPKDGKVQLGKCPWAIAWDGKGILLQVPPKKGNAYGAPRLWRWSAFGIWKE